MKEENFKLKILKVEIDHKSGFCFGVVNAIKKAEETLDQGEKLYCLGDIVHNGMEIKRLEALGLVTIDREEYLNLKNCRVLLRAHGEPPSTYEHAQANNIELIDATCPVVLKLQQRVKKAYEQMEAEDGQIILFGKKGHAEVTGLNGQTKDQSIIIEDEEDLKQVDPNKPAFLFSQTTKSIDQFQQLAQRLQKNAKQPLTVKDTICRQVANRVPRMKEFASQHDILIFVGGKKSSNARFLFDVCKQTNPDSYFISTLEELDENWFQNKQSAGICGATSTPQWLMEQVAEKIKAL
ncbi:4-hydroxy-3-methylbut-2-enyl diphosphate reductase [Sunxiuqinia elliptica]|uniref:4-hydroxy-3-methylbut-2-enyl diphosphate reductase n=1 Tax=Sunxiuqinia elliptica TaxID=655355 RepID=A0A4R6GN60_9BACT|nr:4-hydroxy-3-methylbut-2-enyl diphosphate reductase [Sunxiuqinia elliptica]TDO55769.1 4-hydroxy-3-methylbut-2-enyl diphosphate reductase [Sunxiuqinia elliptica]